METIDIMLRQLRTLLSSIMNTNAKPSTIDEMRDFLDKAEELTQIIKDRAAQIEYQEQMIDRHIKMLEQVKQAWNNRQKILMN